MGKVLTTEADIRAALKRAKTAPPPPMAKAIQYLGSKGFDVFVLWLRDGSYHVIQRKLLQGLAHGTRRQLENVEILGVGTGLHWPDLDADLYVPALLEGFYGNRAWMAKLGKVGGSSRSARKARAARKNGSLGGRPRTANSGGNGKPRKVAA